MPSKYSSQSKKKKHKRKFYKFPKFWSFSRWKVFNDCRARYEYQHLQKLEQPDSPHLERGTYVHKLAEDFLDTPRQGKVPAELKEFADELKAIRKAGAQAEQTLAFTKTWQETVYDDWANCWLRVKIDALIDVDEDEATVIDFKTGKPWKDTADQSELYAVAVFQRFPNVQTVDAEFWYVDSGEVVPYYYSRKDFKKLKQKWNARATEMLKARQFPPTKDAYKCKYCPFRSDAELKNGQPGPCEAWEKAK